MKQCNLPVVKLSEQQQAMLNNWYTEQTRIAVEQQKAKHPKPDPFMQMCWESGYPYTGAIGGDVSFVLTPTAIGVMLEVRHGLTKDHLFFSEL